MPKVALTKEQKLQAEADKLCEQILKALNSRRGMTMQTHKAFAQQLGIAYNTWLKWNDRRLSCAKLEDVLMACQRAGFRVSIDLAN